jgi:hypothetical protein
MIRLQVRGLNLIKILSESYLRRSDKIDKILIRLQTCRSEACEVFEQVFESYHSDNVEGELRYVVP